MIPDPEVDEYHQLEVDAPAPITFAVAKGMDLQAAPIVKGIFWLRAVPTTLALGFDVLAEVPNREIVVGTYTQPWHQRVTSHPLPPEEFATFAEPGYVKIVYTLRAEQLGTGRSRFVTHTRVVTTDAEARRRFRRDWAPMSAGILLIRYVSLPMVKREAERRARNQHRRSDDLPDPMSPYASRPARAIRLWLLRPLIGMVTCDGVATGVQ